jgi:hypothetical protein
VKVPAPAGRRSPRRPRLVGISGVDGSGKTSLAARCVRHCEAAGGRPVAVYVYGCVVCRRWGGRPLSGTGAATGGTGRLVAVARTLHAHLDAGEMTLRLVGAVLTSGWRGGASPVITDRSPLDGLVKHDPPPGSLVARWYLGVARRYDALLWLDGDCETLAARDREHTAVQLADARAGFGRWSARLPNVTRIDTTGAAASDVARLACASLPGGAGGRPAPPA